MVFGIGGSHGNVYSNLKTKLQHVLWQTGGYGDVFGSKKDIQHVISLPGGHTNVSYQLQMTLIHQLIAPGNGSNGNAYIQNVDY